MSLYKRYTTSEAGEKQGIWVDYGDGVQLRLRRAGGRNTLWRDALDKRSKVNRRRIDLGTLSNDEATKLWIDVYADSVLVDWKGVTSPDGTELPFNRDNVVKVLTDLPDFFKVVQDDATKPDLFNGATLEADAKN
jgi:hypothetical protein